MTPPRNLLTIPQMVAWAIVFIVIGGGLLLATPNIGGI